MNNRVVQFDILKIIMSFFVVLTHIPSKGLFQDLAVPCFMFLSFYFTADAILNHDISKIKKRLARLLIPYCFWSILFYIANYALSFVVNMERPRIYDLGLQLLTGHNPFSDMPLWYINSVIILTIVLTSIAYIVKNQKAIMCIYSIIIVGALFSSYSGFNVYVFAKISWSYGNLCNMIVYAILGIIFSHFNILPKLKKLPVLLISIITFILVAIFFIDTPEEMFVYGGVKYIILTILLIIIFYFIPVARFKNKIKLCISFISKYTMGTFCIHWGYIFILSVLRQKNMIIEHEIVEALIIFVVSWLTAYLISLLPLKWGKQLVT
ncbi:MAG: acyltransferase [Lachnospiraceae bacterium]|nr:acyltransferase [Lachnospiraceae bacterium]